MNNSGSIVESHDYYPFGLQMPGKDYQTAERTKELFTGKERDVETGWDYFGARYYWGPGGRWFVVDPLADDYPSLSPYAFTANNPVNNIERDGRYFDTVVDVVSLGVSVYDVATDPGNSDNWVALGLDVVGTLAPGAAGLGLAYKTAKNADKVVDAGKTVDKTLNTVDNAGDAKKTCQTYTKTNSKTGEVYSGRTSGKGTPEQNIRKRDSNHHKNKDGFGPAKLDKSSNNPDAIRGREQQLIEQQGGAKSQGGTSGNQRNAVGPNNPKKDHYKKEAEKEFGKID